MNKIIRWPGLIAFFVVAALLIGVPVLFLDSWIKLGIESAAGKALGAEVNVASVSHTWSPFGLSLHDVQFTDPEKNTHNKLAFESLRTDISLMPLLDRKIIIDHLQIQGVKFDTQRSKPGKIFIKTEAQTEAVAAESSGTGKSMPNIDVAALLKKTPLKTTDAAATVSKLGSASKTQLTQQFEALPDDQALKNYQKQIQAILDKEVKTPAQIAEAKKELDAVKKSLRAEQQKLKDFSGSVSGASGDLKHSLSELAAAQKQDYDLLKGLVAGDSAAIDNLTDAIFGMKLKSWADNLLAAYKLVAPLLQGGGEEAPKRERLAGDWVSFTEDEPLPDILIREADVSVSYLQSEFTSFWKDLTNDHATLGRPTTYGIDSNKTSGWQALKVDGSFKLLATGLTAVQSWDLKGVTLADVELSQSQSLTSSLQQALLNSVGKIDVVDNKLRGKGDIKLVDMLLKASGNGKTSEKIASFLGDLSTLDITTTISGFLKKPQFGFASDLDSQLAKQLSKTVDAAAQKKLAELKSQIAANASPAQAEAAAELASWENLNDIAEGKTDAVEEMLQAQLNSAVDKEKDKLKNDLQKKLFGG
ncbi:uncharacterized protein (TIGR03545 family) [Alteromonadaceae bacterium 2753L.S.0a.02]|nr:uncharacterized protein (TIGR03545 family) [Alteromonadaceae bacterium 2753L.S.0a.02]